MGNSNSISEYSNDKFEQFFNLYEHFESSDDNRYERISIYNLKTNKKDQVMVKVRRFHDHEELRQFKKQLDLRMKLQHHYLLPILGYHIEEQNTACGQSHSITIFIEYLENNLKFEIEKRRQSQTHFTEHEIWFTLDAIVQANEYLQQNNVFHGDLMPNTIFLCPDGLAKICDHSLINELETNYNKFLANTKNHYLSPEQYICLEKMVNGNQSIYARHDQSISDVFSLGIVILQMCLLNHPIKAYYDTQKFIIDYEQIHNSLTDVHDRYSQHLFEMLTLMLTIDEHKRITFQKLHEMMIPFQEGTYDAVQEHRKNQMIEEAKVKYKIAKERQRQQPVHIIKPTIYVVCDDDQNQEYQKQQIQKYQIVDPFKKFDKGEASNTQTTKSFVMTDTVLKEIQQKRINSQNQDVRTRMKNALQRTDLTLNYIQNKK